MEHVAHTNENERAPREGVCALAHVLGARARGG